MTLTGGKYSARIVCLETWKNVPEHPDKIRMAMKVDMSCANAAPMVKNNRKMVQRRCAKRLPNIYAILVLSCHLFDTVQRSLH